MMTHMMEKIISLEWDFLTSGDLQYAPCPCLDNKEFFVSMRTDCLSAWDPSLQEGYYSDLLAAQAQGRNLMNEKFGYLLERTNPEVYDRIKQDLPAHSMEKSYLIDWICQASVAWQENLLSRYPHLIGRKQPIQEDEHHPCGTSFEAHLRSELSTYSTETLRLYAQYVERLQKANLNMNQMVWENTIAHYGCSSLEEAELRLASAR